MRLGINLLNTGASLNAFKVVPLITVYQGETCDLVFQLMDLEQNIRYVPDAEASLLVEIGRLPEAMGTISNTREMKDYSIRRQAIAPFVGDKSIWKLSLTAAETQNMMSSNVRITLTEGLQKKIAQIPQAIKVFRSEA